ncbi:hypothetical protein I204_06558 [Kwoniella mangroviensis CBS 8886]|nr:hypothetical protein I204_06558 [Kwoniella mangroviensis CBS 8886]
MPLQDFIEGGMDRTRRNSTTVSSLSNIRNIFRVARAQPKKNDEEERCPGRPRGLHRVDSLTPLVITNKRRRSIIRYLSRCFVISISSCIMVVMVIIVLLGWGGQGDSWIKHPDRNIHHGKNVSSVPNAVILANSHNDEMQGGNALNLALSLGYGFIEIDTYLGPTPAPALSPKLGYSSSNFSTPSSNSTLDPSLTLLAGHDLEDLKAQRTLKKLYFDPLLDILDRNNRNSTAAGDAWTGIYEKDRTKEVGILIDMKRDGELIWPYLLDSLQPFISKNYLTYYNTTSSTWHHGPLVIIGTGSTPLSKVYYQDVRYIFYDAPLLTLHNPIIIPESEDGPSLNVEWNKEISPMASSKLPFKYYFSIIPFFFSHASSRGKKNTMRCRLQRYTSTAQEKGIKSRWWGVIATPNWLKVKMWEVLWETGQDVLNTDDLIQSKLWLENKRGKDRNLDRC